jgi:hypothetical protein
MYKIILCLFVFFVTRQPTHAQFTHGQLVWTTKELNVVNAHKKQALRLLFFKQHPNLLAKQQETYLKEFKPQFITAVATPPTFFSNINATLPEDYYNFKLGWACKQEWKLEKLTNLPLRLRLGSKEQVDYLEGKGK